MPPEVMNLLAVFMRQMIISVCAALVAHGWVHAVDGASIADTWVPVVLPMIPLVGTMLYGLWQSTLKQKIKAILSRPDVSTVHVAPALASELKLKDVVATPPAQP